MDILYADDLSVLVETLDLKNTIHVVTPRAAVKSPAISAATQHETCGQGRADRCGAAADAENGHHPAACRSRSSTVSRASVLADRSQFFKDLTHAVLRSQQARR